VVVVVVVVVVVAATPNSLRQASQNLGKYIFFDAFFPRFSRWTRLFQISPLHVWLSSRAHISLRLYLFTVRFTLNQLSKHSRPSGLWALWPDEMPEQSCYTLYFSMSSCFIACFMWGQRGVCTLGSVA
jgi:hypothetical protein